MDIILLMIHLTIYINLFQYNMYQIFIFMNLINDV